MKQTNTTRNQNKNMNTETSRVQDSAHKIKDDTQALIAATAEAVGEKVAQARNRVEAITAAAKDTCEVARKKAVEGARATDTAIRENPYQALGIAFGVGALVGFLLSRSGK
jgi:ElaB/YqjD/DUF883 family membrane-anchored ribosome-binding protein